MATPAEFTVSLGIVEKAGFSPAQTRDELVVQDMREDGALQAYNDSQSNDDLHVRRGDTVIAVNGVPLAYEDSKQAVRTAIQDKHPLSLTFRRPQVVSQNVYEMLGFDVADTDISTQIFRRFASESSEFCWDNSLKCMVPRHHTQKDLMLWMTIASHLQGGRRAMTGEHSGVEESRIDLAKKNAPTFQANFPGLICEVTWSDDNLLRGKAFLDGAQVAQQTQRVNEHVLEGAEGASFQVELGSPELTQESIDRLAQLYQECELDHGIARSLAVMNMGMFAATVGNARRVDQSDESFMTRGFYSAFIKKNSRGETYVKFLEVDFERQSRHINADAPHIPAEIGVGPGLLKMVNGRAYFSRNLMAQRQQAQVSGVYMMHLMVKVAEFCVRPAQKE